MIPLHRLATLVYNRPLLITPQAGLIISDVLQLHIEARLDGTHPDRKQSEKDPRPSAFIGDVMPSQSGQGDTPFRVTRNGQAIITIDGELVNRGEWIGADSGLVSYDGIKHQLAEAARDSRVRSIILDVNSPGGEAIGMTDAAAAVRRAASVKPVIGIANGMAASAAYGLLSGATRRIINSDGLGGSVGVLLMHLDVSRALENRGIKPTLIYAGAHKVDGNPFEKLPESVRKDLQAEVLQFYDMFVQTVAQGTGLSPDAIKATEARIYIGKDAVEAGLFDAVGTFDEVLGSPAPAMKNGSVSPQLAAMKTKENGMFTPEFKKSIGLPEAATDAEVSAEIERMRAAAARTDAAEKESKRTIAKAQVDAWEREGKISGNATERVRVLFVAASTGEKVTPEMVADMVAALPKFDTTRVSDKAGKGDAQPALTADVTLEDFGKSATNPEAAKRINMALAARQKTNPKFTRSELYRELKDGTPAR